jgi:hypothetical protein
MVYDIYSKREGRQLGAVPDVYEYEKLPLFLRKQIVLLCERVIGKPDHDERNSAAKFYATVCLILREEYGVLHLFELLDLGYSFRRSHSRPSLYELSEFFFNEEAGKRCLDVIELFAHQFAKMNRRDAISTLNHRIREAGIGYQFESGKIIRVDNQLIHSEVIKPALHFISAKGFEGANEEFLQAHEKYRQGDYKGSLVEGTKALESVLKITLSKNGANITAGDTAKKLFEKFKALNLLPEYLPGQINALYDLLQNSATKPRNKDSAAHGQGAEVRDVPEYLAAYGLHQTASAILLIVKAHEAAR